MLLLRRTTNLLQLPQLFRAAGILKLDPGLGNQINAKQLLEEGGRPEIEIRALTILIGEALVAQLNSKSRRSVYGVLGGNNEAVTAAQLDYYLWRTAIEKDAAGELAPLQFHRVGTTDY